MKIEITVLMSVYNCGQYLSASIESILNQTFRDFEFIIINDGSTDGSESIIRSYNDRRIKYIKNSRNRGLSYSLNKGLRQAEGKYIARMDGDDIADPKRLELQYRFMKNHPDYGLVTSCFASIDEDGNVIEKKCSFLKPEQIFYLLHFRNCIAHSTAMYKKSVVLELGGYNQNIPVAQDYELWERVSKVTRIFEDKRILLYWRERRENTSSRYSESQRKVVLDVSHKGIERIMNRETDTGDLQYLLNFGDEKMDGIETLNRILSLLSEINSHVFKNESMVIDRLNLDERLLREEMDKKSAELVYSFFRDGTISGNIRNYFYLKPKGKISLAKEVFRRIGRKTGFSEGKM